jgi:lysophospholipase L1-like esterase
VSRALRYVALGDSYTIGTAVAQAERWPDQLIVRREGRDPGLDLVANLAVNGFTSQDVIDVQLPRLPGLAPDFLSLLVGVNDVVQGVPVERFRTNAAVILDRLTELVGPARVVTVGTPDYTVTPEGGSYGDQAIQHEAIVRNNRILEDLARRRAIAFVDILDLSLGAATDRSLVADDGLHPSGTQYRLWVERIGPVVDRLLEG